MIVKCTNCHHEWQSAGCTTCGEVAGPLHDFCQWYCDWCGAPGEKLADDYVERWRIAGAEVVLTPAEIRGMIKRLNRKEVKTNG